MSATNNENDYRVTRSRTKPALLPSSYASAPSANAQHKPHARLTKPAQPLGHDQKPAAHPKEERRYLQDVSLKFGVAPPAAKKRPSIPTHDPAATLRSAPHAVVRADTTKPEQARLPQKRLATESSTCLVEKLNETGHKKKKADYQWQDLDEEDFDDPLMVSEYVDDIFPYLHALEKKTLPDPGYLFKQTQLKPKMRLILVDWLVEMHQRFRLLPETLFLAINIMDRFMSVEVVQIDKLQLLATGSLFIAAKYEEVFLPSVKNYAYFTDGLYTEAEILQAEKYILTILNFDLNYPNPMNFLRRISKADDYDVQLRTLGKFLLEITIVDHRFLGILPLLCSAAAMYIARLILDKNPVWNGNLIHYSGGYHVDDMRDCVELMVLYLVSPVEHDEFFKKYATRKFMKASIVCRSWAKKVVAEKRDLFGPSRITTSI